MLYAPRCRRCCRYEPRCATRFHAAGRHAEERWPAVAPAAAMLLVCRDRIASFSLPCAFSAHARLPPPPPRLSPPAADMPLLARQRKVAAISGYLLML